MTSPATASVLPGSSRPTPLQNFLNKGISVIVVTLTALEILSLVVPALGPGLKWAGTLLLVVFLPLSIAKARRSTLVLFLVICAIILALTLDSGRWDRLWVGLSRSMVFGAFLASLQLMRNVAGRSAALREVKARFYELSERQMLGGFVIGAFGIASFLSTGAHAVLAPLLGPDVPSETRRNAALSSLRGFNFAAFWSPFIAPVAFVIQQMPDISASGVILFGLCFGAVGLGVEVLTSGMSWRCLRKIVKGLTPLAPGAAVMAAALIGVTLWRGLTTLEAVVLVVPLLGGMFLAWNGGRTSREIIRASYAGVAYVSDELLLLCAATVFAAVMCDAAGIASRVAPLLDGMPAIVLLLIVALFMLATGTFGCHPSIAAAVVIGVFASMPPTVDRLVLAETVILNWCLAAMVSPAGNTVLIAGQMYRMPYTKLIFSRNLIDVAVSSVVIVLTLAFINSIWLGASPVAMASPRVNTEKRSEMIAPVAPAEGAIEWRQPARSRA